MNILYGPASGSNLSLHIAQILGRVNFLYPTTNGTLTKRRSMQRRAQIRVIAISVQLSTWADKSHEFDEIRYNMPDLAKSKWAIRAVGNMIKA